MSAPTPEIIWAKKPLIPTNTKKMEGTTNHRHRVRELRKIEMEQATATKTNPKHRMQASSPTMNARMLNSIPVRRQEVAIGSTALYVEAQGNDSAILGY